MLEDLRRDARSQIVEKAITTLVEGASVRKYYALLQDGILNNAERLIRRVVPKGSRRRAVTVSCIWLCRPKWT